MHALFRKQKNNHARLMLRPFFISLDSHMTPHTDLYVSLAMTHSQRLGALTRNHWAHLREGFGNTGLK
jgi:hypothetical protein